MRYATKTLLLFGSALMSAGMMTTTLSQPASAQEATIVMAPSELGSTSYNPVASTSLNGVTSLIYDRLVEQDADQSFHPPTSRSTRIWPLPGKKARMA
jgi:peptide/nickel transport system substrate-binding protein